MSLYFAKRLAIRRKLKLSAELTTKLKTNHLVDYDPIKSHHKFTMQH